VTQVGGGVWHGGDLRPGEPVRGYQLWMALPESLELQPAFNRYQDPEAAPSDGRVRVLLGSHGKLRSPITDVGRLAYLHVQLRDGKAWRHQPPADHDVA
jgi:redox-sensitive bicupin YhaK (pirin superfamily)